MSESDIERAERRRWLLWVGAAGALATALVGMLGVHDAAVWRLPGELRGRVEQALIAHGLGGLEVEMRGQQAVLRGVVTGQAAIVTAQRAAQAAAGPGGPWAGGITQADISGLEVGVLEQPYAWRAGRDGVRFVLSGAAPSDAARTELTTIARAAFPNAEVLDEMHVAAGAPSPNWRAVAGKALRDLAKVGEGEVRITDNQIVFVGDGDAAIAEELRAAYANPPAPFQVRIDVGAAPVEGLDLASGNADVCEAAFQQVMSDNVILFETGSAAIDPQSRALLDRLASVALRCDRFAIEVSGHTDNEGSRALNMDLSRSRAQAVADYLMSQGVTRDRLRAVGYGPDRPRESNATPRGQAANRRIEFKVEA